ncbi:MAG: AI-2E family transporter [bacterium]
MNKDKVSYKHILVAIAIVAALVVIVWFLTKVGNIITVFVISAAIAYIINPAVDFLEARRIPRPLAIIGMFLIFVIVIIGGISVFILPKLAAQFNDLLKNLPDYFASLSNIWERTAEFVRRTELPESMKTIPSKMAANLQTVGATIAKKTYTGTMNFFSKLPLVVLIPILVYYFLNDGHKMRRQMTASIPECYRSEMNQLMSRINKALGGYIRGQLKLCVYMGILTGVALAIVGVKYFIVFGFIAGITEFIPYIGPILGIIGPLIFACFTHWTMIIKVLVVFVILQLLENNLLAPRVMSSDVGMHPALIVFILMAGGQIGGITGMIAALPTAVILKVFYEHFYIDKYIDKETPQQS